MEIQIQRTPTKPNKQCIEPCTPPRRGPACEYLNSSSKKRRQMEAMEQMLMKTPKWQNPQTKRQKQLQGKGRTPQTPESTSSVSNQFGTSRLDQDYIFLKKLGEGNFSSVGLYRSRMTGNLFAIKSTKLSSMSVNEAQALGTLSIFNQKSKNIIRYYHSWVQNLQLFLVMQYCNSSLWQVYSKHRKQGKPIHEPQIKDILKQGLQGLKCMHENKMVHLDMKPDNMLLKQSTLKISDLGLARIVKIRKEGDLVEGDSRYMAGELLNYRPGMDLTKADIFSLAITIYEGITLQTMPNNGEKWLKTREAGLHLKNRIDLQEYSQQLLEILQTMSLPVPAYRPSASEILKMPYFKETVDRKNRILMQNHLKLKNIKIEKDKQRKKEGSI